MPGTRRGRPSADESARRRAIVQDAGRAVLEERGYAATTMQEIAARAGVSKESLYSWFGSKQQLFADIVTAEGKQTVERLNQARADGPPTAELLQTFARALLELLCGPWSVTVNRAGMASPELAEVVLTHGRYAVGPVIEELLADLHAARILDLPDPAAAFTELFGLVVRDSQIRVLLGEPAPAVRALRRQADDGVRMFSQLHAPG
ncbi:TetR family transcriptional regulator [Kribbella solani]|uniref:AcrR family transcriptional regulator n=1 Tax=Kribbella solani TaxID=236067 RepID=A0A841DQI9_9ACTN|nr:AcrR family transcriptional regulator [Kribbella solani]